MLVEKAIEELAYCDQRAKLQVEIRGVIHDVHDILEDSQGVYLVVDLDQEEREMR